MPALRDPHNQLRQQYHRTKPDTVPVLLSENDTPYAALAGVAIETRIGWSFNDAAEGKAHYLGAKKVAQHQRRLQRREDTETALSRSATMLTIAHEVISYAAGQVETKRPFSRALPFEDEKEIYDDALIRAAFSMAQLESAYHSNGNSITEKFFLGKKLPGEILSANFTAKAGLHAVLGEISHELITDCRAQTYMAAESPLADLRANTRPEHSKTCVAMLGGAAISGADADLIIDGSLIDIKSTKNTGTLPTKDLQQLAGYILLDTHDEHQINSVGIYHSRNGHLFTVPIGDFLVMGGAKLTLEALREQLDQTYLQPMKKKRQERLMRLERLGMTEIADNS